MHECSTSFRAARGVYRWVHESSISFQGRTGPYPVNLRAQYRRCIASTPQTGSLACTSVVPPFGPHGAYTDGCTSVLPLFGPHGAYTDGCTSAVARFKGRTRPYSVKLRGDGCTSVVICFEAARGRIPIIYARSTDAVGHDTRAKPSSVHERSIAFVGGSIPMGARAQYLVVMPPGKVTIAVSAARGRVRYARAKGARNSVSGALESSFVGSPPGHQFVR